MYNQAYDSHGELTVKLSIVITIKLPSETIVYIRKTIPK